MGQPRTSQRRHYLSLTIAQKTVSLGLDSIFAPVLNHLTSRVLTRRRQFEADAVWCVPVVYCRSHEKTLEWSSSIDLDAVNGPFVNYQWLIANATAIEVAATGTCGRSYKKRFMICKAWSVGHVTYILATSYSFLTNSSRSGRWLDYSRQGPT